MGIKDWLGRQKLENVFLIVFIGIVLWMPLGSILEFRLVHDRPIGLGACDAYYWFTQAVYTVKH